MKIVRTGNFKEGFCLGVMTCMVLLLIAPYASDAALSVDQLVAYKGKDREEVLVEGAKREGALSVYSAMNSKDSQPLVNAFMKKYPFVKVNLFAGRGEDVAARLITEQKGRKYTADTFDAPTILVEQLRREGILIPFYTPAQDIYSAKHIDAKKYWIPIYHNILTFVYNTNEIKDPPKSWNDLLDPRWKGKMTLEDTDGVWLINLFKVWGEAKARDYFTRLGKQELRIVHGHSVMMQMLIAGDVLCTPTQYLHQAISEKKSGAPVNWVIMDPMVVSPEGMALLKNAPHPHAALLFIDFSTSREGQTVIYGRGRNAAYPDLDPQVSKANLLIDSPELSLDNYDHWQKLFTELLLTPNKRR